MEAAARFKKTVPVENGPLGIGVMLVSIVVTMAPIMYQRSVVWRTGSVAISADALHYTGDVLLNGSVIAAIIASVYLGWVWVDAAFAVFIAVFLCVNAFRIGARAVSLLMDREPLDAERARTLAVARNQPEVRDVHDLRTRSSGVQKFMQMHIMLDGALSLTETHRVSDAVELAVLREFPGPTLSSTRTLRAWPSLNP